MIKTPEELERSLLSGSTFQNIDHIEPDGLHDFFNLLSRYGSDDSYTFSIQKPKVKRAAVDPEIEALRKGKETQERALKRPQELYLYSDHAMSEKDFLLRKTEITNRLQGINKTLGDDTG